MAIHETRNYSRRHNAAHVVKAAVAFLGITALAYIAVVAAPHSLLLPNVSSGLLESRMMNPEAATEMVDAQAASGEATAAVATAAAVTALAMDVDYFPNHYVNQATQIEEQPPTF